jgi:thioredoxin reductase (NADPH)
MTDHKTDVAIIGAGPAGLFAIFEAGMLKMKAHVIDALEFAGGQCRALYPEKPIYDIPGYPMIEAGALIDQLEKQASPFNPTFSLGQKVEKLKEIDNGFLLTTSKGDTIEANSIIIAAGCGAFGPNRPPLAGIEQYEGKSVFYMIKSKEDFKDKNVVIAGGGDSAVDWALSLAGIAKHVYVVHRRDKFKCAPESLDRLKALCDSKSIELVVPYQLDSLIGENGQIKQVIVSNLDGEKRSIDADVLLPFFGLAMELGPIAEWGLNIHKYHIDVNPATMETSVKGIFAIGDVATYPGKLKLILNGFAEGAMAAYAIYPRVHPDQALHFEYSTTKGVKV